LIRQEGLLFPGARGCSRSLSLAHIRIL
jgi:hypothetical protein